MSEKTVLQLNVDQLRPNPCQPRRVFDPAALEALAESIRINGILQPLSVRRTADGWQLIAGERRLRAAKLAGLSQVPCLEVAADDAQAALLALLENLQREDLHYLEQAAALAAYLQTTGAGREETARALGCSPSALANKLRLVRLSPACAELLVRHGLSERHARALLRLPEEEQRLAAVRHIISAGLTVAATERYIDRLLQPKERRRQFILKDVRLFLNSLEHNLKLMRTAGVDARVRREETDSAILLTISLPKGR